MRAALLTLEELSCRAGGRYLVDTVTATVSAGEFVALLGPNGAGKSSLLRVLAREYRYCDGKVRLAGRELSEWAGPPLARRRAVLPQQSHVTFPFAAAEIVAMGLPGRVNGQAGHPLVNGLLRWLQVDHLAWRDYRSLSGGEQQRVQLARVLAQLWLSSGPKLLLLDECTSALDPAQQHRVMGMLASLAWRGDFAIIAACHDLALAATHASRIWLMDHGRLVADGAPEQVLNSERLERVYGVRAEIRRTAGHPVIHVQGCTEPPPEVETVLSAL